MYIYFAIIMCHQGTQVLNLEYTTSAKHSAFLAESFIKYCPPAASFKVCKKLITTSEVTRLLNQGV